MIRIVVFLTSLLLWLSATATRSSAGALNFQEPDGWTVGDSGSTFQEWDASVAGYLGSDTPPSASNVNPPISTTPGMGVTLPGFVAGSGGYYSFGGDYSVHANIYNHGGASGTGGPYSANFGTRVFVQTAATTNDDPNAGGPASVFAETLELVRQDGSPITGGDNDSVLAITQVSLEDVLTSFGIVPQQELVFEFWLPGYTDDFRVQFDSIVHSSFQHLRVDTLIVAPELDADFDGSGTVDGLDFLQWQRDPEAYGGGERLALWEQEYGSGDGLFDLTGVPEPASIGLLIVGLWGLDKLLGKRQSRLT